jgi:ABC-type glycerol-3-phosphate transport system substrate-binding protein
MRGLALLLVLAAAVLAGCGGTDDPAAPSGEDGAVSEAGPEHVHGLGVDPPTATSTSPRTVGCGVRPPANPGPAASAMSTTT